MKTSSSINAHVSRGDSHGNVGIRFERVFGRARAQLREAVNDALSSGLEALGDRLQAGLLAKQRPGSSAHTDSAHGHRLREVIERDRALIASSPVAVDGAVMIASDAEATCEAAAERPSQIPLELDTPFLPSGALLDAPAAGLASAAREAPRADFRCGEPIRTRTMAKLLASQGHTARALSIYDYLLAKAPDDQGLRNEATLLRALDS